MHDVETIAKIILQQKSVLIALVVSAIVLTPAAVLLARRRVASRWRLTCAALAGTSLSVVPATTLARGTTGSLGWGQCALQPGLSFVSPEAKLNLLLFVPAVFFSVLATRRLVPVLLGASALSVLVEVVQSLTGLGVCQTSDVVRNVAGAIVAGLVAYVIDRLWGLARKRRRLETKSIH